jgi:hypothetical protein
MRFGHSLTLVSLVCIVFLGRTIRAQTSVQSPLQPLPYHSATSWNSAANRWRLSATDLASQVDPTSASLRKQRTNHWRTALQTLPPGFTGFATVAAIPHPEFSVRTGDVWVIATFTSVRVLPTDSDFKTLYSELSFRLDHIFRSPDSLYLKEGSTVDVDIPGGRLKIAGGQIITSGDLRPQRYSLEPGHNYLIQLLHEQDGEFFYPGQYWDITSGRVKLAHSAIEAQPLYVNSSIAGMTVSDLIQKFPSILQNASTR